MLLNILECRGQPPPARVIQPRAPVVQRGRKPPATPSPSRALDLNPLADPGTLVCPPLLETTLCTGQAGKFMSLTIFRAFLSLSLCSCAVSSA